MDYEQYCSTSQALITGLLEAVRRSVFAGIATEFRQNRRKSLTSTHFRSKAPPKNEK
jgi:hypothetical protein